MSTEHRSKRAGTSVAAVERYFDDLVTCSNPAQRVKQPSLLTPLSERHASLLGK